MAERNVPESAPIIERLKPPVSARDLNSLAELLAATVESGAAVSFLPPLSLADARAWWAETMRTFAPRAILLVARAEGRLVGTVQLHPAWAPNQPHRGEVAKLLVHRDFQQQGLGARLMRALEEAAPSSGISLLTLDAKDGTPAARLYRRLGWTEVGAIPEFARNPDGSFHDAVIMYKALGP